MQNRRRLLLAGFMAILAAGFGFAIRGGIFSDWAREFGFSATELGRIGGAGFTGFCFGIIIGGVVADKIGYGKLVVGAFALHIVSALITFGASTEMSRDSSYQYLLWGMFTFAFANGTLEAVANPLVATLFPEKRAHYLNILHASWPAGLVLGGAVGAVLGGPGGWSWKAQLALYLVPTLIYGMLFWRQRFPRSEASNKGLSLGEMFSDVGLLGGVVVCALISLFLHDHLHLSAQVSCAVGAMLLAVIGVITRLALGHLLLFALFIAHMLVGSVELGTDGWIQNITGNLLTPTTGKWLFVMASLVMFALRFCTDFIERRLGLSPIGILLASSLTAALGLSLISHAQGIEMIMIAVIVYAVGKTYFWPTMLAVASDRFPRTGAIAISIMGGIGMMAAGLIGTPGLGYFKDRYTAQELQTQDAELYAKVRSSEPKSFLFFEATTPVDGKILADALATASPKRDHDQRAIADASVVGDRRTLQIDALIPLAMAAIFVLLAIYFWVVGGYRRVRIDESSDEAAPMLKPFST